MKILIPDKPTRKGQGSQKDTIIDYFIINERIEKSIQKKIEVIFVQPDMSDHNAVCLHIDNEKGDRKIKV